LKILTTYLPRFLSASIPASIQLTVLQLTVLQPTVLHPSVLQPIRTVLHPSVLQPFSNPFAYTFSHTPYQPSILLLLAFLAFNPLAFRPSILLPSASYLSPIFQKKRKQRKINLY